MNGSRKATRLFAVALAMFSMQPVQSARAELPVSHFLNHPDLLAIATILGQFSTISHAIMSGYEDSKVAMEQNKGNVEQADITGQQQLTVDGETLGATVDVKDTSFEIRDTERVHVETVNDILSAITGPYQLAGAGEVPASIDGRLSQRLQEASAETSPFSLSQKHVVDSSLWDQDVVLSAHARSAILGIDAARSSFAHGEQRQARLSRLGTSAGSGQDVKASVDLHTEIYTEIGALFAEQLLLNSVEANMHATEMFARARDSISSRLMREGVLNEE
jgi:hypothetical protein